MRLSLLLVALSWCALAAGQDAPPEYDYYELGVEEAPAANGDAPAADLEATPGQDEVGEAVPVTEATTEKTTTTEAGPKGRRKLVSINKPPSRRRPTPSERRALALAAAAAAPSTTEAPSRDTQTPGRVRGRRPSRRGQTQTESETTTTAAPTRRGGRFRPSARTPPTSNAEPQPSSPRTSSRRGSTRARAPPATTEAPASSSHRFSSRRRSRLGSNRDEEKQEETPAPTTPNRFGRRRLS